MIEGSLADATLADILRVVSHHRRTGILTVQGEANIVAVSFLDGQVVAADALNQTVEEGLGTLLVADGLIERPAYDAVAARHQAGAGRLIDLLVDSSGLARGDVLAALRRQAGDLVLDLFRWRSGEFKFYAGDEVFYEEGLRPIPVEELLVADLRRRGDARLPLDATVYQRTEPPGLEVRDRLGEPRPGEDAGDVLWLTPEERRLWDLLDEGQTVASLTVASGYDASLVRYGMFRFAAAGALRLLTPELAAEAAAAASAPVPSGPALGPALAPLPAERPASLPPLVPPAPRPPSPRMAPIRPPEPVAPSPVEEPPRRTAAPGAGARVAFWAGVAAALVALWAAAPGRLLLPFPWQAGEVASWRVARDDSRDLRIDRAAKTYFLLQGRFPDDLGELVETGLLFRRDLEGADGRPLAYLAEALSYRLEEGSGATGAVNGDFLLDPDFFGPDDSPGGQPLVLLD